MGFNKYYIPKPADFAGQVINNGPKNCVTRKIDAIIGDPESIKMFDFIYGRVAEGRSDSVILVELRKKFPDRFNAEPN